MEDLLAAVRAQLQNVRVPSSHDRVFKDECMFSFANGETDGGIFINMNTWHAFGKDHVLLDHQRTGNVLYYNERHHRVPLSEAELKARDSAPSKMAIGDANGFDVDKKSYTINVESSVVLMPSQTAIPLPCPDLPEFLLNAIAGIQANDGAVKQEQTAAWEEERKESKYARSLEQLAPTRKISPKPADWKCDSTGVTENLWLNLSTGHIGSGRRHWDGSGGNGAALRHFEETGKKYPLVVKLGTINPHGADVYSYAPDEDDLVTDPLLKEHLAHWGINMMAMDKSVKTMAELQIDMNLKFDFEAITERGSALKPVQGPGTVGLDNLGNYCYMSSILQAVWGIPALADGYVRPIASIRQTAPPEVLNDFMCQFAKIGEALVAGATGKRTPEVDAKLEDRVEANAVAPHRFKALIGRNHPDFGTGHQQDACEFFLHLVDIMGRSERQSGNRLPAGAPPLASSSLFTFDLEYRTQCSTSGAVSYKRSPTAVLSLDIPLDAATNTGEVRAFKEREAKRQQLKEQRADVYIGSGATTDAVVSDEKEEPVIPHVPYEACMSKFAAETVFSDYYSPAIQAKGTAVQTTRIASFPPYLMVQLRKYYVDDNWQARKMDVLVAMPHNITLDSLRGHGAQPSERLQPEEPSTDAATGATQAAPAPSADIVAQLTAAGFSENACKRAALAVSNSSAEDAMNWLLGHMDDGDINDPLPIAAPPAAADAGAVEMLTNMGFLQRQAAAALKACSGSVERAADWLFSRTDNLDAAVAAVEGEAAAAAAPAAKKEMLDGPGKYELVAIISHIGSNTACGHYVSHVKKAGHWYIFNDSKVALSERLPLDLGYMFLYRRSDQPWA